MISLNHAIWFHAPADPGDGLFYRSSRPWAGSGRELLRGYILTVQDSSWLRRRRRHCCKMREPETSSRRCYLRAQLLSRRAGEQSYLFGSPWPNRPGSKQFIIREIIGLPSSTRRPG